MKNHITVSMIIWSVILVYLAGCTGMTGKRTPLPDPSTVKAQKVVDDIYWAEGPALDRQGNLYIPNYLRMGTIGKVTPDGNATVLIDLTKHLPAENGKIPWCNGLKVDDNGNLVAAETGTNHIIRIAKDGSKVTVLASACNGQRFTLLNDVALDGHGNIYFSNPGNLSVCRYNAATGTVDNVTPDPIYSNGIGISPDGKYLVLTSDRRQVMILDMVNGIGRNMRVLMDFRDLPDSKRGPLKKPGSGDGLVFDEFGRLYVAVYNAQNVRVIDVPAGRLLANYDAGGVTSDNVHFYNGYLYVTIGRDHCVNRLPIGIRGWQYSEQCGF